MSASRTTPPNDDGDARHVEHARDATAFAFDGRVEHHLASASQLQDDRPVRPSTIPAATRSRARP